MSIVMNSKIDRVETKDASPHVNNFFTGGSAGKNFALLKHLYQCSDNILVILGEDGIGKSSFKTALLNEEQDTQHKFCCITADSTINPGMLQQEISQESNLDLNENLFLIIDDAHSLPSNTLKYLIDLASTEPLEGNRIQLILFGKPILEQRLLSSQIAAPKDKVSVLELEPLGLQETAEYVMFKWCNNNTQHSFPFSKKQLKKIYHLSKGNPKQIELAAQQLLYGQQVTQNDVAPATTKKSLTPILLGAVITLGILGVCLAYIVQPSARPNDTILKDELTLPIENQALEELQAELGKEQTLRKELEKWILEQDKTIELLKAQNQDLHNTVDLANLKTVEKQSLQKKTLANSQELDLLKLDPNHFTLQLIGLSQESAVKKFINSNNLTGRVFYYRTKLKNKPWYVVLYGNYPSQILANDAIKNLPDKLQQLRPYPQKIAVIQKFINTNLQR